MFLNLNHKSLTVYSKIRELTKEIYKISNLLPVEERFNMVQQIRRAGLSVKLNFAEGSTRRSTTERKRYYEISRGSIVEIDAKRLKLLLTWNILKLNLCSNQEFY